MKRIISSVLAVLLVLVLIAPTMALEEKNSNKTLVYLDVTTGQRVEFKDDSPTLSKSLEKWLEIAHNTFGYHDGTLKFRSIKISNGILTIDFSKEFHQIDPSTDQFEMLIWSLKETVFSNTKIKVIHLKVAGKNLEHIGEFDYTGGIKKGSIKDVETDFIARSYPDVPNPIIVIDPGHGGTWNHSIAPDGALEKNIVLEVAQYLKADLQGNGATVFMTRETDVHFSTTIGTDLAARVNIANNKKANLFISLHTNGGPSYGTEAFWPEFHHVSSSKALADAITAKLSSRHGLRQRYNRSGDLQVLRDTTMTSTLVELLYITNQSDYSKIDSSADKDAIAYSVYLGIRKFWWGY